MPQDNALTRQEGGRHYKDMPIQPVEYIHANDIGYFEGNVIKYVSRWRTKAGVEDLRKARHYIDLLIEMETRRNGDQNAKPAGAQDGYRRAPDAYNKPYRPVSTSLPADLSMLGTPT